LYKTISMKLKQCLFFAIALLLFIDINAQSVIYSAPDRDDARNMNFEVLGKLQGNFLIYKNYRNIHTMSVYDDNMKLTQKNRIEGLPDKLFNADFITYPNYAYMFYQYQKRNIVYCMAQKIDASGKQVGQPLELDTTVLAFNASNKIYSSAYSENKQRITFFKINTKSDKQYVVTTLLFNPDLTLLHKSVLNIDMPEKNDYLTGFELDNDGNLAFLRAWGSSQNDNITGLEFYFKPALENSVIATPLNTKSLFLDDMHVKFDNENHHCLITGFFAKQRRGNVEGLYNCIWDETQQKIMHNSILTFPDELRADARGESGMRTAFNNYYIHNIIMRKDGGYILAAESAYSSSRGNPYNRWDYMYGSPFYNPYNYYYGYGYGMGLMGSYFYPWSFGNPMYNMNRFYADNIMVLSFNPGDSLEWSNVIHKSQFDDNTDAFIGYGLMNSGDQLHFLFNTVERRQSLLTDQSITPDGQIVRNPLFKNLDRGYQFMPRQGKQTGLRQMIIPCQYRGYITFAKVVI
jgi:hypothetical protein